MTEIRKDAEQVLKLSQISGMNILGIMARNKLTIGGEKVYYCTISGKKTAIVKD